ARATPILTCTADVPFICRCLRMSQIMSWTRIHVMFVLHRMAEEQTVGLLRGFASARLRNSRCTGRRRCCCAPKSSFLSYRRCPAVSPMAHVPVAAPGGERGDVGEPKWGQSLITK